MNTQDWQQICPGCFEDKGNTPVCPHCGYDENQERSPLVLPHRTLLHGQYLIGRVLGKPGGFGITYLAFDTRLENRVAIKEYLPRDYAGRKANHTTIVAHSGEEAELFRFGLEQFLQEGRTIAKMDHANIVRVRNFFEENGTGYLVMDYYEGTTLAEYLQQQGGRLPEKTAVDILMPILDGLREVHEKDFLHRDIKPQNIYLTTGGRPILLDFGAARMAMGERSRSLSVVMTPGYAPYEQYHRRGEHGPWTDIYSCAATLYHMLTGEVPPEATERVEDDPLQPPELLRPELSPRVCAAVMRGLAMNRKERPGSMREFQAMLLWEGAAAPKAETVRPKVEPPAAPTPPPVLPSPAVTPSSVPAAKASPPGWAWGLGGIAVAGLVFALMGTGKKESAPLPAPALAAAPAPVRAPAPAAPAADAAKPADPVPSSVPTFRDCPDCPEMVEIPAGRFTMGSPADEKGHDNDEGPQHEVRVKQFALGKTEVTVGEFRRFVRASSYKTEAERNVGNQGCSTWELVDGKGKWDWRTGRYWDDPGFKQSDKQPVACISWNDAKTYVKWLSKTTGKHYRLPSEAEWEYAARAGSTTARYWGNNPDDACRYANVGDQTDSPWNTTWSPRHECNDKYYYSSPVANYTANAFGLHDMIGNVWEWVEDCSHDSYNGAPVDGSAWVSKSCPVRVLRGGSWISEPDGARSAERGGDDSTVRYNLAGFRLARMLP